MFRVFFVFVRDVILVSIFCVERNLKEDTMTLTQVISVFQISFHSVVTFMAYWSVRLLEVVIQAAGVIRLIANQVGREKRLWQVILRLN